MPQTRFTQKAFAQGLNRLLLLIKSTSLVRDQTGLWIKFLIFDNLGATDGN